MAASMAGMEFSVSSSTTTLKWLRSKNLTRSSVRSFGLSGETAIFHATATKSTKATDHLNAREELTPHPQQAEADN